MLNILPVLFLWINNSKGSHEWIIEFEKEPSDLNQFIEILDNALKSVNSDYEAKRFKDLNLVIPVVRSVPGAHLINGLSQKINLEDRIKYHVFQTHVNILKIL